MKASQALTNLNRRSRAERTRGRHPRQSIDLAESVRDALAHLHDLAYLQTHPLTEQLALAGQSTRLSNSGLKLRQILEKAIDAIKPALRTPETSHAWRGYEILRLRYLEALEASEVWKRLAIGKSEYYRDHNQAIEAVVALFIEQLRLVDTEQATISEREAAASASRLVPMQTPPAPRSQLPRPLSSLVGRERELAEIKALLSRGRLLALTGSGGVGKTRLALKLASDLLELEVYPDGVWWADLASLSDPSAVSPTVAASLGLLEQTGYPILSTLIGYLRPRHLLLVLDNCEHLVDACAALAESLLQACPNVRVLATSRQALGISGETSYRVPSLSLPDVHHMPALERLVEYESVRLFVERAQAVLPSFVLTKQNAPLAAQICWRLDGIPLAIELAAARLSALTVEQVAARLDDRFRLLTEGSRTALRRQQTLRATIDWSYDLLSEPERVLLRRLAVFAGGWRLEAAEVVCSGEGLGIDEVLDLLARLVNRSLVVVERGGAEARYQLPETIRQYALERLLETGEAERVRDRQLAYHVDLGERYYEANHGPDEVTWLDTLALEYDNLRAALAWSLEGETARAETGLRLAGALGWFWFLRVHRQEGLRWLDELLARCEAKATPDRARALTAATILAWAQAPRRALSLSEEAEHLYRQLGDDHGVVLALCAQGRSTLGDLARSRTILEEALAVARGTGERWLIAYAQVMLAYDQGVMGEEARRALAQQALPAMEEAGDTLGVALAHRVLGETALWRGDYAQAARSLAEDLARTRALGDAVGVAVALRNLGDSARLTGGYEQAATYYEEALSVLDAVGWSGMPFVVHLLCRLGDVALDQGDIDRAAALYSEGLARARRTTPRGDLGGVLLWACSRGLAAVANRRGQSERAARLLGIAPAPGEAEPPWMRAEYIGLLSVVRSQLSEDVFTRAYAEGQAMTLEQAVEYALQNDAEA